MQIVVNDKAPRDRQEVVRLAVLVAIAVLLGAFVVDNRQSVRVGFVVTERRAPLIWVLVVTAAIGALLGWLWRRRRG